jgi:hypothetical protein
MAGGRPGNAAEAIGGADKLFVALALCGNCRARRAFAIQTLGNLRRARAGPYEVITENGLALPTVSFELDLADHRCALQRSYF